MRRAMLTCAGALLLCSCYAYEAPYRPRPAVLRHSSPAPLAETGAEPPARTPLSELQPPEPVAVGEGAADDRITIVPLIDRIEPPILRSVDHPSAGRQSEPYAASRPAEDEYADYAEGDMVVDRRGQMVPAEGGGWVFRFERSANEKQAIPPMKLLPCDLLAGMEDEAARRAPGPVTFRITGEVTQYRGRTFLLPVQVLVAADLSELSGRPEEPQREVRP